MTKHVSRNWRTRGSFGTLVVRVVPSGCAVPASVSDPSGAEHGFLAQFQRTLIRLAGPVEESAHLRHHVEDVRAGRFVIMVLAKNQDRRDVVARILDNHGAEFVGFYGRWAVESMSGRKPDRTEVPGIEKARGETYESELEELGLRLRIDVRREVVDAEITRTDGTVHRAKGVLRRLG